MGADTDGSTAQNPFGKPRETSEKNIFLCEIYFSEVYGALMPLPDSENLSKSPHTAAFSIGNPIQNLLEIQRLANISVRSAFPKS